MLSETALRLPATVLAIAAAALLVAGDLIFREGTMRDYALIASLSIPFLIPWSWASGSARSMVLVVCVGTAAIVVTARVLYLLAWFYPRRPLFIWVVLASTLTAVDLAPWLSFAAAVRRWRGAEPAVSSDVARASADSRR